MCDLSLDLMKRPLNTNQSAVWPTFPCFLFICKMRFRCQNYYILSWWWLHLNTKCTSSPAPSHWWESSRSVSHLQQSHKTTGATVPFKDVTSFSSAKGKSKSHNLMTAETEYQEKGLAECWSDVQVYQIIQAVFQRGPQGNIDGKAGLLILEKLLIWSLLALRTLITPIVVLVPLRPEWMSLLWSSFLLPLKWRRSHQNTPGRVRYHTSWILHLVNTKTTQLIKHQLQLQLCIPKESCAQFLTSVSRNFVLFLLLPSFFY